ncbi:AraC family transcriptional regulator [Pseudomonas sp. Marseille-QA0892]
MNSLLSESSRIFERADPYAVSGYVNQHVGNHCIRLPASGFPEANLSHRKFSTLDLCTISYGGAVRVTSPALETIYHLQLLMAGHCRSVCLGQEHFYRPGELLLINPDDPVDLTYSADCEKFIVKLPAPLFQGICLNQRWQIPEQGIRFEAACQDPQSLAMLVQLLTVVCAEAEATESCVQVQDHYVQIIASKLLGLVANNVCRIPVNAHGSGFERVVAYIDEHLNQDIRLSELVGVAGVSERTLYAMFDRHVGVSPKDYIRQRKLQRIHALLKDPSAVVRSVTAIALDHGFLHLGRFSESYRLQFGELPSETLRRRG